MKTFQVYSQDSFCFPGCLPEGGGPESNGDRFDTRDEAIDDACRTLIAILEDEREVNGDSAQVNAVMNACVAELRKTGETSCELPWRDEDTDEVSNTGYRLISFAVEEG